MLQGRKKVRTSHLVIAGHLLAVVFVAVTCDSSRDDRGLSGVIHYSGEEFAGSETCADCHQSIAESHFETPHFLTSRPANNHSVKGSFDSAENVFQISERLKVVMEKNRSGLFQVGVVDGQEVEKRRMDITIGSGRKGQTYLYWDSSALFQLPVSYYAPLSVWCNSPGYPDDAIAFRRNIQARCLECHSTFFRTKKTTADREIFDRSQAMLGVDCERCHGPATNHVTFHRDHPEERTARHIVNPAMLSRQQRLDNCALCHSGIRDNFMPSFTFTVGDNLEDFSYPGRSDDGAGNLDVHGNQYGLLTASKCFKNSPMDCGSCHDVHARESGRLELFSMRCMNCHEKGTEKFCTQPQLAGLELTKNCIDCHMPALPSRKVFLQAPDSFKTTPFLVRTHLVATYPEEVARFLAKLNPSEGQ